MKTALPLALLFIAVLAGGFFLSERTTTTTTSSDTSTTTVSSGTASTTDTGGTQGASGSTYTAAQVAMHADASSCWAIINGNVYDLTQWIGQHPGGPDRILSICGKDGSSAFDGMHGSDPRALSILATFKIGTLAS